MIHEVSSKWAGSQTITGPVLVVPYTQRTTTTDEKIIAETKLAYFLPDELSVSGDITPQIRKRSLYDVALFRSRLNLSGTYKPLATAALQLQDADVQWGSARLLLGIGDARGLEEEVTVQWNGLPQTLEAGVPENTVVQNGLSAPVGIAAGGAVKFSLSLALRGSVHLYVTPVGKATTVTLASKWKHPAFDGAYLPNNQPQVSDSGFTARWNVLQVSRSYPQQWKDAQQAIEASAFGVRLVQPADSYVKTSRSVKYAILFIGLTFIVFFLMEIIQKKQVHPLQYILVGITLCIFYTLLLSVSEYLGFNTAYFTAAAATTLLIAMYVWSLYRSGSTGLGFGAALGGLYGYIYILLQLEDYALLFGSIGLFLILAVLMYVTRKIDWYGAGKPVD